MKSMQAFRLKLWATLIFIGMLGVFSLLLSEVLLENIPPELTKVVPPAILPFVLLVNPSLLLLVFVTAGVFLFDRAGFRLPLFEKVLGTPYPLSFDSNALVKKGLVGGALAGIIISLLALAFDSALPEALRSDSAGEMNIVSRLLYGGITEELITRFGLMTILAWLLLKVFKNHRDVSYWLAIFIAAFLFALAHMPMLLLMVDEPDFAAILYVLIGNSVGGIIFGYLYWKQGLESAMLAHATAHLVMMGVAGLF